MLCRFSIPWHFDINCIHSKNNNNILETLEIWNHKKINKIKWGKIWGIKEMATILQTFSNVSFLMKVIVFSFEFCWSLFLRVQLTKDIIWNNDGQILLMHACISVPRFKIKKSQDPTYHILHRTSLRPSSSRGRTVVGAHRCCRRSRGRFRRQAGGPLRKAVDSCIVRYPDDPHGTPPPDHTSGYRRGCFLKRTRNVHYKF